ncbi:NifU family protein [Alicyclobacillus tolerans]|uniref:NifU family protein n=1 Tax=Alicyclobacillus tolerans TaxID=90970 RepID=UPI001F1F285D|nr:NifU family protein [Alicyclobacillus tolerans]MCF8565552.1 NifU family protein [Alicyclobacillus tolerans]
MEQSINEALQHFRPGLEADGADVKLKRIDGMDVYLQLVLTPECCMECLLPKEVLEPIFRKAIIDRTGHDVNVFLEDPRLTL